MASSFCTGGSPNRKEILSESADMYRMIVERHRCILPIEAVSKPKNRLPLLFFLFGKDRDVFGRPQTQLVANMDSDGY